MPTSDKVLITHKLLQSCEDAIVEKFDPVRLYQQSEPDAFLAEHGVEFRAVAGGNVDKKLMDQLPNLKMVSNFGVGYDTIDTAEARARGIHVTNTPDVLNDAMAEITIGLMVALARRIPQADRYIRDGKWTTDNFPLQAELTGRTVGMVGLGRIGQEIAARCQAMKMRVVYHARRKRANIPYIYYSQLDEMARDADWLVVITPGGSQTENLINRNVLDALGVKGYLVNMARGSVVDEAVLVEKLTKGEIAGAALDVFADEPNVPEALFSLDNVVLSPHQGSATHQTRYAMGALVVANLEAFFAGEPLLTPVT